MSSFTQRHAEGTRQVRLSDKQEFSREEQRLNRRAPLKEKKERKSFYEKLLDEQGY